MINYIVQVVLFQILFLVVYDLFLQKETFFKWNRLYLLATPVLSFIIPFIKFESLKNSVSQESIIWLPEVVLNPEMVMVEQMSNPTETFNLLNWLFYIGVGVSVLLFLWNLTKIVRLIRQNKKVKQQQFSLVLMDNQKSPFSFFNYIFIHKDTLKKDDFQIIQHELVHAKQYHTLDLLFFEIFKIAMWFNPLIFIYQKRITVLHEFISDAEVVKENDKKTYFNNLLSQTFNVEGISFTNQFYKKSLIKKRIAMITKTQSHKLKQLKYLVLVPLLGGMLMYSSCKTKDIQNNQVENFEAKKELVTLYSSKKGKLNVEKGRKETYLDMYTSFDGSEPLLKGNLIKRENLSAEEQVELEEFANNFKMKIEDLPVIQIETGRKVVVYKLPKSKKLNKADYKNAEDVPFAVVDESPTFEICTGTQEELKSCFNKELQKFVAINFDMNVAKNSDITPGKKKIYTQFKILKTGEIEIVGVRAPHPDLEKETRRVIGLLPEIKPGKFDGKEVNVTYMLPITFNIADDSENK
ncbi:M56 family metallopeptidase [Urechidicola vernalis]|uniref:M56 family metallopeptidase n=1 Tax=Urechidicola vernalis TaxID=3075600 RepID=A0ABU2Y576_9FLAO|nr:M56 family metallopeptidase [Urechidicola sp. P050]MDT0552809.1 M56 family metallopeptidase [Urechidicola sp. P050]